MIDRVCEIAAPMTKRWEGLHKLRKDGLVYPYICPAGYWTQGYGILCDRNSAPIVPAEASRRFDNILPGYIVEAFRICPRLWLSPPEMGAAIGDFTFNLGAARLRGSTLRRKIADGDWEAACRELRKWVFGGGKKLPGLVSRREDEIKLIQSTL